MWQTMRAFQAALVLLTAFCLSAKCARILVLNIPDALSHQFVFFKASCKPAVLLTCYLGKQVA